MTIASRFSSSALRRWQHLGLLAALIGLLTSPATAQTDDKAKEPTFIAIRAADTDTIGVNSAGQLQLGLSRAPAAAANAMVYVVNSAGYALWSAPLTRSGGNWTAKLDRAATEDLLVANAIHAAFPGAATGGKELRISFVRDMFQGKLDATASLVGTQPLFYKAPDQPAPLVGLPANPDPIQVARFAMAARRYDEQLSAYQQQLIAARASAHSLWVDLKTAGRLPNWPAMVVATQDKAYAALDNEIMAAAKQRADAQAAAKATIDQWNRAHAGDTPVELTFRAQS